MSQEPATPPAEMPKVYLLPNLMTAGNLCCGFLAILEIITGTLEKHQELDTWIGHYENSLVFILAAFIFDMLDGRLARLGGRESSFGREFDSLADVVSFGLAPALLVYKIVLAGLPKDLSWLGGLVAFLYLLAGAMRLARFNIVSAQPQPDGNKDFIGFPIPAAAGLVASITLLILTLDRSEKEIGNWQYLLPVLLLFLSFMMYSQIRYPSFKATDWKAKRSIPQILITVLILAVLARWYRYSLALVFVAYLIYGFIRPYISKRIRAGIEEEDDEETETRGA